jgi:uncharacterized protein YjbI with pentapeptide repeats
MEEASDQIIQSLPDEGDATIPRSETEALLARIECFIERSVETGTMLDLPADRRVAQALIDYWLAKRSELTRDRNVTKPRLTQAEVLLKPFARTKVDSAVKRGDVILERLDWDRKALLRRLLFRLVKFPESGDKFGSDPATRQELEKYGDTEQVCLLLDQLRAADILSLFNKNGTQIVTLKYLALIRQWPWLSEQVDERMTFRSKAASWQEKGKHRSELLKRTQRKIIRSYGNLDKLEQELLNESDKSALRVKSLVGLGAVILGGALFFSVWIYDYSIFPRWVAESEKLVTSSGASSQAKAQAIRWLANKRGALSFPSVTLRELKLQELRIDFPNFSSAQMQFVDFRDASLRGANFRAGTLAGVNFENANLESAGFDGATIKPATSNKQANAMFAQASFKGANLVRATFDDAIFCGEVDFSNAEVREASFENVNIDQGTLNFDGTAWWLAYLSPMLLDKLAAQVSPGTDKLPRQLETQLQKLLSDAANLSGSDRQATLLAHAILRNEIAWRLAIYGIYSPIGGSKVLIDANDRVPGGVDHTEIRKEDLTDGIALSRQSIDILKKLNLLDKGAKDSYLASFSDTLAYLFLERAAHEENVDMKNQELNEAIGLWDDINLRRAGGPIFRHAVALSAFGNQSEAQINLNQAISMNYAPTHELYLLKAFIKKPILDTLQEDSSAASKRNNTESCVPNQ